MEVAVKINTKGVKRRWCLISERVGDRWTDMQRVIAGLRSSRSLPTHHLQDQSNLPENVNEPDGLLPNSNSAGSVNGAVRIVCDFNSRFLVL